jgi:hypothetical protein
VAETLATLVQIRNFFGMTSKEMTAEFPALTSQDKMSLKVGIGNGSLTY